MLQVIRARGAIYESDSSPRLRHAASGHGSLGFAQPKPLVVSPFDIRHMSAEVDDAPSFSLRPDGQGRYRWEEHSRAFENGLALFLCTEVKTCSTLPQVLGRPVLTRIECCSSISATLPKSGHESWGFYAHTKLL